MNILVTGGTGFVGNNLIRKLLKTEDVEKIVLLKRKASDLSKINDIKNKLILVDIEDIEDFNELFVHKIDIIIHLSSKYTKSNETKEDVEEMNFFNISLPSELLFYAIKNNVKGYINTGSFFEFKHENTKKISEKTPLEPFNYYAATKIAFEEILKYYSKKFGIKSITLKLFSPYGESQENKIIPLIINSFLTNRGMTLNGGKQKLSFTYIDDIVNAYLLGIKYIFSNKYSKYESFNIGTSENYSIKEIIKIASKYSNNRPVFNYNSSTKNEEINFSKCDNSKAKQFLGWNPKYNLETGIKRTIEITKNVI